MLAYIGKKTILRVLSPQEPLYSPNIENQVPYSLTDLLEEDQWFYIEDFGKSDDSNFAEVGREKRDVKEIFSLLSEFCQFQSTDYARTKWLITKQGESYYYQKLLKVQKIEHKTFLGVFEGSANITTVDNSIEIREKQPDVIYCASSDRLLFKSFSRAKDIYPELTDIYREATDEDVASFIESRSDIVCNPSFEIGIRNRRDVTRLTQRMGLLTAVDQAKLSSYIVNHLGRAGLNIGKDGKIHISTATEFKAYLDLLDERFITSDIYSEDRRITAFRTV